MHVTLQLARIMDLVMLRQVVLVHVAIRYNLADVLTKPVSVNKMARALKTMVIVPRSPSESYFGKEYLFDSSVKFDINEETKVSIK